MTVNDKSNIVINVQLTSTQTAKLLVHFQADMKGFDYKLIGDDDRLIKKGYSKVINEDQPKAVISLGETQEMQKYLTGNNDCGTNMITSLEIGLGEFIQK